MSVNALQRQPRQGFALLAVLWILIGISVLALGASLLARGALATVQNRIIMTQTRWRAEGCLARAQAAMHAAITSIPPSEVIAMWDTLDNVLRASPMLTSTQCHVEARALGDAVNINEADSERLTHLFLALGIGPARTDSLVSALIDWRDADDTPRPEGAERAWYVANHRLAPRDSQFADVRELLHVRGFEHFGDTLQYLTTQPGRIALSHAPLVVLATLPGMTSEALTEWSALRIRHERVTDLLMFSTHLSPAARQQLIAHYEELTHMATAEPDGWILSFAVTDGTPAITSTIHVRLARAGTRIAIMSRWS